jgi:hypothetical protein
MQSTRYSCQVLMKLEFCLLIFEIYSDSKFLKIRLVGAQFHSDRETDGQADMWKLIVVFLNFANAPTKTWW